MKTVIFQDPHSSACCTRAFADHSYYQRRIIAALEHFMPFAMPDLEGKYPFRMSIRWLEVQLEIKGFKSFAKTLIPGQSLSQIVQGLRHELLAIRASLSQDIKPSTARRVKFIVP